VQIKESASEMSWNKLEKPWQECFKLGWESYKKGSIPIGAVITDNTGEIIASGRSLQYEEICAPGEVSRHKLSHAELNALLKVSEFDHPNIRQYTLYTTTEPCPLCFGALVMANVRSLKYAARDRYAGSTNLNDSSEYIKSKNIKISGPFYELEKIQVAIHTAYELKRNNGAQRLLNTWRIDCPSAVELGIKLFNENVLEKFKNKDTDAESVFDTLYSLI
jgi:tRNA(adenine34) deaminase